MFFLLVNFLYQAEDFPIKSLACFLHFLPEQVVPFVYFFAKISILELQLKKGMIVPLSSPALKAL